MLEDFYHTGKIQRLRPGLNPRTRVPEANMLTTRPPKPSALTVSGIYTWGGRARDWGRTGSRLHVLPLAAMLCRLREEQVKRDLSLGRKMEHGKKLRRRKSREVCRGTLREREIKRERER